MHVLADSYLLYVRNNRSNSGVNQGVSSSVATLFMEHHRRENCRGKSCNDVSRFLFVNFFMTFKRPWSTESRKCHVGKFFRTAY